jgi:hypothetical protein
MLFLKFNSIISAAKHAGNQNVYNSYKLLTPFIPLFVKTILKSTRQKLFPCKVFFFINKGDAIVSVFAASVVDRGFEPRSGQTKDYAIDICCFTLIS